MCCLYHRHLVSVKKKEAPPPLLQPPETFAFWHDFYLEYVILYAWISTYVIKIGLDHIENIWKKYLLLSMIKWYLIIVSNKHFLVFSLQTHVYVVFMRQVYQSLFPSFFHVFCCLLVFDKNIFKKSIKQTFQSVKLFRSRSGPTFCRAWSGSKLFAKVISRRR